MKYIQNTNLIVVSIVVFILICLVAGGYYINNLMPKKLLINDNVEIVERNEMFEIEDIEHGKIFSKITIKKKMKENELKKYTNYTLGNGENYYLDYTIILDNNKKSYKVKTIIEDKKELDKKDQEKYIYIKGIFLNRNFFKEKYNIGILQKDYKENYKNISKSYYKNIGVIGESNEEDKSKKYNGICYTFYNIFNISSKSHK